MVTDRATSARARNAMTFEAVPPGQHETRIRPTAKGVGRSSSRPMLHPSSGISVYCSATPGRTLDRSRAMRRKSSNPTVMPMLSMMTPRPTVMNGPLNQVNSSGRTRAMPLARSSQSGKALVRTVSTGNPRIVWLRRAAFQPTGRSEATAGCWTCRVHADNLIACRISRSGTSLRSCIARSRRRRPWRVLRCPTSSWRSSREWRSDRRRGSFASGCAAGPPCN